MPGATPNILLPYAVGGDAVKQGDDAIKDLALAVDTAVKPLVNPVWLAGASGAVAAGATIGLGNLNIPVIPDGQARTLYLTLTFISTTSSNHVLTVPATDPRLLLATALRFSTTANPNPQQVHFVMPVDDGPAAVSAFTFGAGSGGASAVRLAAWVQ